MQSTHTKRTGRKTRHTRRNLIALIIVLCVILATMIGAGIYMAVATNSNQPNQPAQPVADLVLPETVTMRQRYLLCGSALTPGELVSGLDGTQIAVSFEAQPDTQNPGWQTVTLRFARDNHYCLQSVRYYCFTMTDTVEVNLNEDRQVGIRDYISDENVEAAFHGTAPADVDRSVCGKTSMTLVCDGVEYPVIFHVMDNVPPTATGVSTTFEAGADVDPATLVENIVDHTAVTVTFAEGTDLTAIGTQTIKLILTDEYSNTAQVESVVVITKPRIEPEFTGLGVIYIQVGETIAYKKGVTCIDPQDGSLDYTVDKSQVDPNTEGTYYVTYSATDADGHTVTLQRKVVVEMVNQEVVERYAQKVLDKIIKDGMTRDQMINAVYNYTRKAVQYVGSSDKSSVMMGAYEGFTTGLGDCYTYYAMNMTMLNMLGIENVEVTRIGGTSHHWWNLVLFEDGMYYHVDSCPVYQKVDGVNHGKMTEADLVTYINHPGVINRRPNYYVYDGTLPQYQDIVIAP